MRDFVLGLLIVIGLAAAGYWRYSALPPAESRVESHAATAVDPALMASFRRISAVDLDSAFFSDPLFNSLRPLAPERPGGDIPKGRDNPFAPL